MSIETNINTPLTNNFQATTGSAQMNPKITPQNVLNAAMNIIMGLL